MHYAPPSPEDLQRLKNALGYTGDQMAELAGVSGNRQWRKYTGGEQPREMGPAMLFLLAARLVLSPAELERIAQQMRAIGAEVEFSAESSVQRLQSGSVSVSD